MIVTGPPASGKTTLARAVAAGARLPLFAKDELKEILYDTLGTGDVEWSRRLGIATYPLLFQVARAELAARRSFVLEANFATDDAGRDLERLRREHPFRALQLVCRADVETLVERYVARAALRHRGHLDRERVDEVRAVAAAARHGVLDVPGAVVEVDTTDWAAVDTHVLVEHARRWTAESRSSGLSA